MTLTRVQLGRSLFSMTKGSYAQLGRSITPASTFGYQKRRVTLPLGRHKRQIVTLSHVRPNSPSPVLRQARYNSSKPMPLKSCLNCGETQSLESLSCPACNLLQPLPSDIDFFKVMDLNLSKVPLNGWKVDMQALKRAWRLKMAITHPDRMGSRSEKEQQIGAQQSALVNRAYETLLNPLARAHYLLQRHGAVDVSESDSLEDPELLMEVMELREQLEEAQTEDEAAAVRAANADSMQHTLDTLAKAFGSSPPDLDTARQAAVQLRYWTNIDKAAREWSPGTRVELQH